MVSPVECYTDLQAFGTYLAPKLAPIWHQFVKTPHNFPHSRWDSNCEKERQKEPWNKTRSRTG
jgi:hypothetical protein